MSSSDHSLDDLPGVGPATAKDLKDNGYTTIEDIAMANPDVLSDVDNIGDDGASNVVFTAQDMIGMGGFDTGADLLQRERELGRLSWGVDELDAVFGGGLKPSALTEVYGRFSSGKSQIAMYLSVRVQLDPEHGGLGGSAAFVDVENTFSAERVEDFVKGLPDDVIEHEIEKRGIEGSLNDDSTMEKLVMDFLSHIHHTVAFNSTHQRNIVKNDISDLGVQLEGTDWPLKFLAVDSLMAHFRSEYTGRGNLANRQQSINKHLTETTRIANKFEPVVLFTNQAQENPDQFFGNPMKPVGGNIVGHKMEYRTELRKKKDDARVAELIDSPDQEQAEGAFRISSGGITDA